MASEAMHALYRGPHTRATESENWNNKQETYRSQVLCDGKHSGEGHRLLVVFIEGVLEQFGVGARQLNKKWATRSRGRDQHTMHEQSMNPRCAMSMDSGLHESAHDTYLTTGFVANERDSDLASFANSVVRANAGGLGNTGVNTTAQATVGRVGHNLEEGGNRGRKSKTTRRKRPNNNDDDAQKYRGTKRQSGKSEKGEVVFVKTSSNSNSQHKEGERDGV